MTLRLRIALLSCATALASAGVTGLLLVAEARRHAAGELLQKQLLFAQNRAFALGYNLELATRELVRLSERREVDPTDNDPKPEAVLLESTHSNSTLFNAGLMIYDARGRCFAAEPASEECPQGNAGRTFAEAPWFIAGGAAREAAVVGEPAGGKPRVSVVVPIRRGGAVTGVLRGIIDLGRDGVVSAALFRKLPPSTEVALVTQDGVLYPAHAGDWSTATAEALSEPDAFVEEKTRPRFLYAHAKVAQAGWGLLFRWPYALLDDSLVRLLRLLSLLLAAGGVLAVIFGLVTSRFLSEPLNALVLAVRRLGQRGPQDDAPPPVDEVARRPDELGELARAFRELRDRLREGDARHGDDLLQIRELAASLEERVAARTAELEAAQRSLLAQERLAAMGQAAAVISHELKNSLGAIGMGVDLIASDAKGEGLSRVHMQVRSEVTRLRTLTDELLVFARSPRISRQPVDLQELSKKAAAICAEQAQSAGVQVELALWQGGAPLWASCDGERIQSVLVNLLQNAIEAVAWQKEPRDPRRAVRLSTQAGALATVAFEDSGPGVSAEAREHLFEPFFTTKRNGTGLGLATAQRFVSAHGGRIELQPGQALPGARFAVLLPIGEAA